MSTTEPCIYCDAPGTINSSSADRTQRIWVCNTHLATLEADSKAWLAEWKRNRPASTPRRARGGYTDLSFVGRALGQGGTK